MYALKNIPHLSIFFTALSISLGLAILLSILKAPAIFIIFLACFVSIILWQIHCNSLNKIWTRTFFILAAESLLAPILLFLTVASRVTSTAGGAKLGTLFAGTVVVGMAAAVGITLGIVFLVVGFVLRNK